VRPSTAEFLGLQDGGSRFHVFKIHVCLQVFRSRGSREEQRSAHWIMLFIRR
jgi:hypothetical protein